MRCIVKRWFGSFAGCDIAACIGCLPLVCLLAVLAA